MADRGFEISVGVVETEETLFKYCINGYMPGVTKCLEGKVNPNCRDKEGFTPLIKAAGTGRVNVCNLLLSRGAEINAVNSNGDTALHYATMAKHQPVVDLLLKSGADATLKNKRNQTPVFTAQGNKEIQSMVTKSKQNSQSDNKNVKEGKCLVQ